ncbi:putative Ig domain-containing protein [Rhizobium leguminosarum]|uniref:putative Ig domain-containing protein n=1 Tax=Rhizobium leguminosarum TaxID=384 RepID=UPI003F954A25
MPPAPPAPIPTFAVSYEPNRFIWHVGEPVVLAPDVRFGSGRYDWTVAAGALPAGLVLGQTGAVYGSPRMPGRYSWTVLARDVETGTSATATASAVVQ